jgi:hypothetical protein
MWKTGKVHAIATSQYMMQSTVGICGVAYHCSELTVFIVQKERPQIPHNTNKIFKNTHLRGTERLK